MEKIRVCIGSVCEEDSQIITDSHLGDTRCFYIYDLNQDGSSDFIDKRANTAVNVGHSKKEKMQKVLSILKDVHVLVSARLSPNFIKMAKNTRFQPIIVKGKVFSDVLQELSENRHSLIDAVTAREQGIRPGVITFYEPLRFSV